jgi:RNA polymerase sigma factor (sigma-70 family)
VSVRPAPERLVTFVSDADLVAGCRQAAPGAWSALVHRFSSYVWAIALQAYRLSEHDAEDVFQEVFAKAYERLPSLRSDEAIRPWLAQLTRNACVDRLRSDSRVLLTDMPPEPIQPDPVLERLADALTVRDAVIGLPEHCREIIDRFFIQDQSYEVIGAEIGISAGTIASRISRCLGKLRAVLSASAPAR